MDAPRQPDGPPIRDGMPYSRIAHLAEDMVRPFVAIGARAAGRRPERAGDARPGSRQRACCWSRTSATACSAREIAARRARRPSCGGPRSMRWSRCAACRCRRACRSPDGTGYTLPRRDRDAFEIEIELLLDWYWPALKGEPVPQDVRAEFIALWAPVLDRLLGAARRLVPARLPLAQPDLAARARGPRQGRHHRLPGRAQRALRLRPGLAAAGRARRRAGGAGGGAASPTTVPRSQGASRPSIAAAFAAAYADFGAQRNTRLLGLLARLLKRDGKPQYLQHIPRTWGYLARNLRAPAPRARSRRGTTGTSRPMCGA